MFFKQVSMSLTEKYKLEEKVEILTLRAPPKIYSP